MFSSSKQWKLTRLIADENVTPLSRLRLPDEDAMDEQARGEAWLLHQGSCPQPLTRSDQTMDNAIPAPSDNQ